MKKLNEKYQRKLRTFLWDLQTVIADTIQEDTHVGFEYKEFTEHLDAYNRLYNFAYEILKKDYMERQREENMKSGDN